MSNKTDKGKKRKADEEEEDKEEDMTLIVEPYVTPNRGPYPYNQPKRWEAKAKTWARSQLNKIRGQKVVQCLVKPWLLSEVGVLTSLKEVTP